MESALDQYELKLNSLYDVYPAVPNFIEDRSVIFGVTHAVRRKNKNDLAIMLSFDAVFANINILKH
jgi:hypothetical protein